MSNRSETTVFPTTSGQNRNNTMKFQIGLIVMALSFCLNASAATVLQVGDVITRGKEKISCTSDVSEKLPECEVLSYGINEFFPWYERTIKNGGYTLAEGLAQYGQAGAYFVAINKKIIFASGMTWGSKSASEYRANIAIQKCHELERKNKCVCNR